MSAELVKVENKTVSPFDPQDLGQAWKLAESLSRSGIVPEVYRGKPDDIFSALMMGHDLGLSPMQALLNIDVIKGRPGLNAFTTVALAKKSPLCKFFRCTEATAERATYETWRVGEPGPESLSFTIEDAKQMGLVGRDSWRGDPKGMLRRRASKRLAREVYPDVVGNYLDPDEIEDMVSRGSEVMTAPPPPAKHEAPPTSPPKPTAPHSAATSDRRKDGPTPEASARFEAASRRTAVTKPMRGVPPASDAGPDPRGQQKSDGPPAPGEDRTLPRVPATAPRDDWGAPTEDEPTKPGGEVPEIEPPKDDSEPKPVDAFAIRVMDATRGDLLAIVKEANALTEDREYALDLVGDRIIAMLGAATEDAHRVQIGEAIRELPPRVQQVVRPAYNAAAKRLMPPKA